MKKLLIVNAGITALLGSGMAQAGFSPYYAGAGVGSTSNNGSENDFCPACAGSQFNMHKQNQGYKVYGGVNLTNDLAIEGEYADLGKTYNLGLDSHQNNPALDYYGKTQHVDAHQKTHGIGVSVKANRRIARKTSVYGKVGAFAWENKLTVEDTGLAGNHTSYRGKDSGISPTLGVGVEHDINNRWTVRAGWDHYFKVGKGSQFLEENPTTLHSVKTDVDMVYVGATFNF
jgi:hypothetical protein